MESSVPVVRSQRSRIRAAPKDMEQVDECATSVLEVVPLVMDTLRAAMRQNVGEQLSVPQFRCLNFIAREPGSSISAVASFLGVTMPTASAMVDRLVRAGAVKPRSFPGDRRRTQLHITAAGKSQLGEIRRGAHDDLVRALASLGARELRELKVGLDVLRHAFSANAMGDR
jgi:DNA-binding MarR family transcriptional regulator